MNDERDYQRFYCEQHKPPTPAGWQCLPNLRAEKRCDCGEVAQWCVFVKPLAYPKLSTA
jgi:hypothetical protein